LIQLSIGKSAQIRPEIRDTLFGDRPLSEWGNLSSNVPPVEPWNSFRRTENFVNAGDRQAAIETLSHILEMPGLESRHYLQAWHFLRDLGVQPPMAKGKILLGVVFEVGMAEGTDLLAAYPDYHARYYNFSGAGVIWERPNDSMDAAVDNLLRAGSIVLQAIGPWKGKRPPAPSEGKARINLLSPSGLHFGEGPFDVLGKDSLGGPVIKAAFQLMKDLMAAKAP